MHARLAPRAALVAAFPLCLAVACASPAAPEPGAEPPATAPAGAAPAPPTSLPPAPTPRAAVEEPGGAETAASAEAHARDDLDYALGALTGEHPVLLELGTTTASPDGAFEPILVYRRARSQIQALRACLLDTPGPSADVHGSIELLVTLDAAGTVASAQRGGVRLEPPLPPDDPWVDGLSSCAAGVARTWTFAAPTSAPVTVTLPLLVTPRHGGLGVGGS